MVESMAYIQHTLLAPWFLTGVVASRSSSVNSLSAAGLAGLSQAIITSAAKTKYVIRIYIINKYRNKVTQ